MMTRHLITEVKQQWAMLVLGWVTIRILGQPVDVSDVFVTQDFHKFWYTARGSDFL